MGKGIVDIFPEIGAIESEEIRNVTEKSWEIVQTENPNESIAKILWAPHFADDVGEQNFVRHVRSVTRLAMDITETLTASRDCDVNVDHVIAGALLHDISKPFEHAAGSHTKLRELLGHPHFGIYVLETAGVPREIQHISLAHTPRSGVPPKTIEAVIVKYADEIDTFGIYAESQGQVPAEHPSK
jgi:putative nucleotidyltransferase with HDIG domain